MGEHHLAAAGALTFINQRAYSRLALPGARETCTLKRTEMARKGAEQLFAAEAAIDRALSETANLAGLLPALRLDSGLSAVVGQDAIADVSRAITALAEARGAIVNSHGALNTVKDQIGCRTVSFGDLDKPDGNIPTQGLYEVKAA